MSAEATRGNRILLVDPDPQTSSATLKLLTSQGYDVDAFETADEASDHARSEPYGVAVLEVEVGEDSGIELFREIQRANGALRVIFHVEHPTVDSAKQALNLGAYAYLEKSDGESELLRSVESAFRLPFSRHARGIEELVAEHTRSLKESEDRFRDLVETTIDWIWETDAGGRYTYVGPQVRHLLGYAPEDLIGRFILEIVPRSDFAEINEEIGVVRDRTPRFRSLEMPLLTKDGSVVIHEMRWVPVSDSKGEVRCFRGIGRDVTEARRLEERFRQSQKLDAVGRLAGGIAHDFNNLLTVVLGNSEILVDELDPNGEARELAVSTLEAAERGRHLTNQLLSFARQRRVETRDFDLGARVVGLLDMLRRLIGDHIDLDSRLSSEIWARADPGQIEQVLVNLAINARDAMEDGGRLTIEATSHEGESSPLWIDEERVDSVSLRISDTGTGIPPENLEVIFEPFFSTKSPDKGAGLGLSSAYGIIQQAKGDIRVESRVGHGTTFHIVLPAARAREHPVEDRRTRGTARVGSERILLVEDEPAVRKVAARNLEAEGYSVTSFGRPEHALAYATAHFDEIDLLVTDMLMPNMLGSELAERIRLLNRDLRVLFVSGYSEDRVGDLSAESHSSFLQKPFTRESLLAATREAIDE